MNDIYKAVPDIKVKLFANDTNVFLSKQEKTFSKGSRMYK